MPSKLWETRTDHMDCSECERLDKAQRDALFRLDRVRKAPKSGAVADIPKLKSEERLAEDLAEIAQRAYETHLLILWDQTAPRFYASKNWPSVLGTYMAGWYKGFCYFRQNQAGFSNRGGFHSMGDCSLSYGHLEPRSPWERIYHDAGAITKQGLRRAELLQLIRPVERDELYRPMERRHATFTGLV